MLKKALSLLLTVFSFLIGALFLVILLPVFMVWALRYGYAKLWRFIRHDPQKTLTIKALEDNAVRDGIGSREEFAAAFKQFTNTLVTLGKAKAGKVEQQGFELFDTPTPPVEAIQVSFTRTLTSPSATVRVTLDLTAEVDPGTGKLNVELDECETAHGISFAPMSIEIVHAKQAVQNFTASCEEDFWFVLGLLRGTALQAEPQGQIGVFVSEYSVWLVQYNQGKSAYGQRRDFAGTRTHEYWFDTPPTAK